jgi:hypothetical protein
MSWIFFYTDFSPGFSFRTHLQDTRSGLKCRIFIPDTTPGYVSWIQIGYPGYASGRISGHGTKISLFFEKSSRLVNQSGYVPGYASGCPTVLSGLHPGHPRYNPDTHPHTSGTKVLDTSSGYPKSWMRVRIYMHIFLSIN